MKAATTLLMLGLVACGPDAQDVSSTSTDTLAAPDLAGSYVASLDGVEGCEADVPDALAWMAGALEVSGPPEALVFRFADGTEVTGATDTAFEVTLSDEVVRDGTAFDVAGVGLAYIDADLWILDVDLEVGVRSASSEFPDCSVVARLQAGQISE